MRRAAVAVIIGGYAFWGIGSGPGQSGPGHQPVMVDASLTADVKPVKAAKPGRQIVKFDGYSVSVPASWPVYNLNKDPRQCVRYDVHAVYLGTPGPDQNCPASLVGRVETVSIEGPAVQARKKIAGDRKTLVRTGQRTLTPGTIVQDPDLHELAIAMPDTAPRIDATYGADPGTAEQMLATVQQAGTHRPRSSRRETRSASRTRWSWRRRISPTRRIRPGPSRPGCRPGSPGLDPPGPAVEPRSSPPAMGPALEPKARPALPTGRSAPACEPATGPALEPAAGPALEPATGPALEPAAGPALEPATGPALEPAAGPPSSPPPSPPSPPSSRPSPSVPAPTPTPAGPVAVNSPSPSPSPSSPSTAMAGFDTCAAPSLPTMKAWRAKYAATAIYIGGQMMACGQSNLSASWVQQAEAMGWSLMPTFVGLQAPCDSFSGKIDPKQAAAQGTAAANQAIADANSYGLGPGAPVYYDMEAYDHTKAGCRAAVLTFLDAWTRQMEASGYVSGVYSSADAAIIDLQSTTSIAGHPLAEPQAVWFALWDNTNNLAGAPYMTSAVWPVASRSKQYAGNRVVKVGGISLDIDADWVASAVARG